MTSTDGVYIDGKLSVSGDMTGPKSAHMILRDPSVDAAVSRWRAAACCAAALDSSAATLPAA